MEAVWEAEVVELQASGSSEVAVVQATEMATSEMAAAWVLEDQEGVVVEARAALRENWVAMGLGMVLVAVTARVEVARKEVAVAAKQRTICNDFQLGNGRQN